MKNIPLLFLATLLFCSCSIVNPIDDSKSNNDKREQLGIPVLTEDWEEYDDDGDLFTTYWWKKHPRTGHFKKVITYNLWRPLTETDYYQYEEREDTLAWSSYDFEQKTLKYYLQVPLENPKVIQKGEWKVTQTDEVIQVSKEKFNRYISGKSNR